MNNITLFTRYDMLVDEFLRSAKRKGLTTQTIKNYASTAATFRAFLKTRYPNDSSDHIFVDYADVTAWIDYTQNNDTKSSTARQRLVELNVFFTFCTKPYVSAALRYERSPVTKDFYPKTKNDSPICNLPDDCAVAKLWENECRYPTHRSNFPRNYAIVVLMLSTGIRNKELLDLTITDIDFANKELTVRHGKGDKYRVVDIPDIALTAIELYMRSDAYPDGLPDDAPIFGTKSVKDKRNIAGRNSEEWHRGSRTWLSDVIERHVYNQIAFRGCRSHDLRHLFARVTLNANGNLAELQGALGHTSPVVTERYSGRLMARRRRDEARAVLDVRDEWARRNSEQLAILRERDKQKERSAWRDKLFA